MPIIRFYIAVFLVFASTLSVRADVYPDRTVRIIVGSAAGGTSDLIARIVAAKLADKWHEAVLVEDMPGADATIAMQYVAKSPADGYVLALANTNHVTTPSLRRLPYDPIRDFAPVTNMIYSPDLLLVNSSLHVNTLRQLIALAKAKPGVLNFATPGGAAAPGLEMALLMQEAGLNLVGITYAGTSPALVSVLGNETQLMFGSISSSMQYIKTGRLKALAISNDKRIAVLPDVPTFEEAANLQGFDKGGTWFGIMAPAGTSPEIVSKLHDDIVTVLRSTDVQKRLQDQSIITIADTPAQFGAFIKTEIPRWAALIKTMHNTSQ